MKNRQITLRGEIAVRLGVNEGDYVGFYESGNGGVLIKKVMIVDSS